MVAGIDLIIITQEDAAQRKKNDQHKLIFESKIIDQAMQDAAHNL